MRLMVRPGTSHSGTARAKSGRRRGRRSVANGSQSAGAHPSWIASSSATTLEDDVAVMTGDSLRYGVDGSMGSRVRRRRPGYDTGQASLRDRRLTGTKSVQGGRPPTRGGEGRQFGLGETLGHHQSDVSSFAPPVPPPGRPATSGAVRYHRNAGHVEGDSDTSGSDNSEVDEEISSDVGGGDDGTGVVLMDVVGGMFRTKSRRRRRLRAELRQQRATTTSGYRRETPSRTNKVRPTTSHVGIGDAVGRLLKRRGKRAASAGPARGSEGRMNLLSTGRSRGRMDSTLREPRSPMNTTKTERDEQLAQQKADDEVLRATLGDDFVDIAVNNSVEDDAMHSLVLGSGLNYKKSTNYVETEVAALSVALDEAMASLTRKAMDDDAEAYAMYSRPAGRVIEAGEARREQEERRKAFEKEMRRLTNGGRRDLESELMMAKTEQEEKEADDALDPLFASASEMDAHLARCRARLERAEEEAARKAVAGDGADDQAVGAGGREESEKSPGVPAGEKILPQEDMPFEHDPVRSISAAVQRAWSSVEAQGHAVQEAFMTVAESVSDLSFHSGMLLRSLWTRQTQLYEPIRQLMLILGSRLATERQAMSKLELRVQQQLAAQEEEASQREENLLAYILRLEQHLDAQEQNMLSIDRTIESEVESGDLAGRLKCWQMARAGLSLRNDMEFVYGSERSISALAAINAGCRVDQTGVLEIESLGNDERRACVDRYRALVLPIHVDILRERVSTLEVAMTEAIDDLTRIKRSMRRSTQLVRRTSGSLVSRGSDKRLSLRQSELGRASAHASQKDVNYEKFVSNRFLERGGSTESLERVGSTLSVGDGTSGDRGQHPLIDEVMHVGLGSVVTRSVHKSRAWMVRIIGAIFSYLERFQHPSVNHVPQANPTVLTRPRSSGHAHAFAVFVYEWLLMRFRRVHVADQAAWDVVGACRSYSGQNEWIALFGRFLSGQYSMASLAFAVHALQAVRESSVGLDFPSDPDIQMPRWVSYKRICAVVPALFPALASLMIQESGNTFKSVIRELCIGTPAALVEAIGGPPELTREGTSETDEARLRISCSTFVVTVVRHADSLYKRERARLSSRCRVLDANGDGCLTLDEFETLVTSEIPCINRHTLSRVFIAGLREQTAPIDSGASLNDSWYSVLKYEGALDSVFFDFGLMTRRMFGGSGVVAAPRYELSEIESRSLVLTLKDLWHGRVIPCIRRLLQEMLLVSSGGAASNAAAEMARNDDAAARQVKAVERRTAYLAPHVMGGGVLANPCDFEDQQIVLMCERTLTDCMQQINLQWPVLILRPHALWVTIRSLMMRALMMYDLVLGNSHAVPVSGVEGDLLSMCNVLDARIKCGKSRYQAWVKRSGVSRMAQLMRVTRAINTIQKVFKRLLTNMRKRNEESMRRLRKSVPTSRINDDS